MIKLAIGLKQLVVAQLFLAIFLPFGRATSWQASSLLGASALLLLKLVLVFLVAGLIENSMARTRFIKTPRLTGYGLAVAVLALLALLCGL